MSDRKISKAGIDFIKGFESFVPYVYDDARPSVHGKYKMYEPGDNVLGTLTCLYGHTDAAKYPLKIKDSLGKTFTEAYACEVLDVDLDECEGDVNSLVKVPLTQGQFDACVSLVFNMGAPNFKESTLLARLNRGDYAGARRAFDLYVNSKRKFSRGLQRRRDGEQLLWDRPDAPETPPEPLPLPSEPVDHPAEVDAPKPANVVVTAFSSRSVRAQGASIIALVVGFFDSARQAFNSAIHFVLPAADYIPDVVNDTQSTITQSEQVASWFNLNITHLAAYIAIGGLSYAIIRRVLDKREQQT